MFLMTDPKQALRCFGQQKLSAINLSLAAVIALALEHLSTKPDAINALTLQQLIRQGIHLPVFKAVHETLHKQLVQAIEKFNQKSPGGHKVSLATLKQILIESAEPNPCGSAIILNA
ncbi:MAG: hypothetical protein K5Q00_01650, partial [Gammaproteobacteria bacterium]|nr:hypothetical protein [Gammaproteobacteria bacterium]